MHFHSSSLLSKPADFLLITLITAAWWPAVALINTSSYLACAAWQAGMAVTDPLLPNIMALFPSAQKLQGPGSFSPLSLLMRNHGIYVYMKLAVFLLAFCLVCFHPQRGSVSQYYSYAARDKKKQKNSSVVPCASLPEMSNEKKKWLGFMSPDSFK